MTTMLYVATNQGVVSLQEESAGSWAIRGHALQSWDTNDVAVSPTAPERAYVATRGDGVWRSDDYGDSWRKPSRGRPAPGKVKCVTIDPHDANKLWAGTEPIGIWVSGDGGANWEELTSVRDVPGLDAVTYPGPTVEPHIRDIVIDARDPGTVYATVQVGFMIKSTDGGETWSRLENGLDADAHTLVQHPEDMDRLFLATGGGGSDIAALFRSEDAGASWKPMATNFKWTYSIPLVMRPDNPDVLYSALANNAPNNWRRRDEGAQTIVVRSKDGGDSWDRIDPGFPEIEKHYAEAIAIHPSEPDRMFLATRSGALYSSPDAGETWADLKVRVPEVADMKAVEA